MIRKIIIIIAALFCIIAIPLLIYRYQVLQYTTETLIRKYLPSYVKIDTMRFDFRKGDILLGGFKILNPPGFSKEYLIEIEKITCHYKMRGRTIIEGLELDSPVLNNAVLNIERLANKEVNLVEAQVFIEKKPSGTPSGQKSQEEGGRKPVPEPKNRPSAGVVKLPESFLIKGGKIIFTDRAIGTNPNIVTFENINTELILKMDEHYTKVLAASSTGAGYVNGDSSQAVKWTVDLNPATPRLTMSSRFDVSGVLITPFEPYYDKYSPLVFSAGKFSGVLVFNFDNGTIGSTDELALTGMKFSVKQGSENAQIWETTVPDLVKYFTSPYGEIIFDFKIKGDMSDPKFYLGPKSKEAIFSMAVDKISAAIQNNAGSGGGVPKNDIEKAQQYIGIFKGLIKK